MTDGFSALAQAGQFSWIDGGRHTTDITYVDNAVEGLLAGWQHGKPGQAYFITDQEPVQFREFMQTVFDIYGVETPIPDIDLDTAVRVVPVPARWFIGQTCTLRTDKAVKDLGYRPVISRAAALDTLRRSRQPEAQSRTADADDGAERGQERRRVNMRSDRQRRTTTHRSRPTSRLPMPSLLALFAAGFLGILERDGACGPATEDVGKSGPVGIGRGSDHHRVCAGDRPDGDPARTPP